MTRNIGAQRDRLTWSNLTFGSKIMLPTYVAFCLLQGSAWVWGDPRRTLSPSFNYAKEKMPMTAWGTILICLGILLIVGYFIGWRFSDRRPVILALLAGASFCAWWTVQAWVSINTAPEVPPGEDASKIALPGFGGPIFWSLLMLAFIASAGSLAKDRGRNGLGT